MEETITSRIKAANLAEMFVSTYSLIRNMPHLKIHCDVCWLHENEEEYIVKFQLFAPRIDSDKIWYTNIKSKNITVLLEELFLILVILS